jgi:hypothetical protein
VLRLLHEQLCFFQGAAFSVFNETRIFCLFWPERPRKPGGQGLRGSKGDQGQESRGPSSGPYRGAHTLSKAPDWLAKKNGVMD